MATTGEEKIPVTEERAPQLEDSVNRLAKSGLRAGVALAMLPINLLPSEPRKHLRAAGSELTQGVAALLRSAAEALDEVAERK